MKKKSLFSVVVAFLLAFVMAFASVACSTPDNADADKGNENAPKLRLNAETDKWEVSFDNGETWKIVATEDEKKDDDDEKDDGIKLEPIRELSVSLDGQFSIAVDFNSLKVEESEINDDDEQNDDGVANAEDFKEAEEEDGRLLEVSVAFDLKLKLKADEDGKITELGATAKVTPNVKDNKNAFVAMIINGIASEIKAEKFIKDGKVYSYLKTSRGEQFDVSEMEEGEELYMPDTGMDYETLSGAIMAVFKIFPMPQVQQIATGDYSMKWDITKAMADSIMAKIGGLLGLEVKPLSDEATVTDSFIQVALDGIKPTLLKAKLDVKEGKNAIYGEINFAAAYKDVTEITDADRLAAIEAGATEEPVDEDPSDEPYEPSESELYEMEKQQRIYEAYSDIISSIMGIPNEEALAISAQIYAEKGNFIPADEEDEDSFDEDVTVVKYALEYARKFIKNDENTVTDYSEVLKVIMGETYEDLYGENEIEIIKTLAKDNKVYSLINLYITKLFGVEENTEMIIEGVDDEKLMAIGMMLYMLPSPQISWEEEYDTEDESKVIATSTELTWEITDGEVKAVVGIAKMFTDFLEIKLPLSQEEIMKLNLRNCSIVAEIENNKLVSITATFDFLDGNHDIYYKAVASVDFDREIEAKDVTSEDEIKEIADGYELQTKLMNPSAENEEEAA